MRTPFLPTRTRRQHGRSSGDGGQAMTRRAWVPLGCQFADCSPTGGSCLGRRGRVKSSRGIRRVDPTHRWRGGRVAEGGGLLNRYTVNSRIVGSNPIPSARALGFLRLSRVFTDKTPGPAPQHVKRIFANRE